ncbi:unnamed protein product [Boreogadus saida]
MASPVSEGGPPQHQQPHPGPDPAVQEARRWIKGPVSWVTTGAETMPAGCHVRRIVSTSRAARTIAEQTGFCSVGNFTLNPRGRLTLRRRGALLDWEVLSRVSFPVSPVTWDLPGRV